MAGVTSGPLDVRRTRLVDDPDADWERFAVTDPYWAVLTEDKYRGSVITPAALSDFFRSGEQHVSLLFQIIRSRLDPAFSPVRAMDYGCGVGRVAIPLAKQCREVVAVDVAPSMLAEGRRHAASASVSNVEFVLCDDELSAVSGKFELVHSYIVLQHLPPHRGERIAQRLIDVLAPNGIGAVHVAYHLPTSPLRRATLRARQVIPFAHAIANVLRGRPASAPFMQMNAYSLTRILNLLQRNGCHDVHIRFTDHGGVLGAVFFFRKAATETFP